VNDSIWNAVYSDTLAAVAQWFAQDEYIDSLALANLASELTDTLADVAQWFATDEADDAQELADSIEANSNRFSANDEMWTDLYDNLNAEFSIKKIELQEQQLLITGLENDLESSEFQNTLDSTNISDLNNQLLSVNNEIYSLSQDLSTTISSLTDTTIALNSVRNTVSSLEVNVDALENALSDEQILSLELQTALDIVELDLSKTNYSLDSTAIVVISLNEQLVEEINRQTDHLDSIDVLNNSIISLKDTADLVHSLTDTVISLELQLEDLRQNPALVPINVDLLAGWNIIGFTLPNPQDMAATFDDINSDIQIVKNNEGKTYWPEFGFNGIGDIIPGQGYQIRLSNPVMNYSFKAVTARMELTPTVPQWVYELEVPMHPNDIRTLDRVINLSGQEVDPSMGNEKGKVLLYLYNDGTVEKRWNK